MGEERKRQGSLLQQQKGHRKKEIGQDSDHFGTIEWQKSLKLFTKHSDTVTIECKSKCREGKKL